MELYKTILAIHVFAGFTALGIGLIPMLSKKGGTLHKRTGAIYFWAMFGVFITSSIMFFFKPDKLVFLFLVGIFSFYQTLSGARILKYKSPLTPIHFLDKFLVGIVCFVGLLMIFFGVYEAIVVGGGQSIVYLVFGSILLIEGIYDGRLFFASQSYRLSLKPNAWLIKHISRMGGSYIATFTAFVVVNNTFMPNIIGWLGPTIIGSIILAIVTKKYKIKQVKV